VVQGERGDVMFFVVAGHTFWILVSLGLSLLILWVRMTEKNPLSFGGWLHCLPVIRKKGLWNRSPKFQEVSISWAIILAHLGAMLGIAYSFAWREEWWEAILVFSLFLLTSLFSRMKDSPEVLREVLEASEEADSRKALAYK
jgi:hypothetical protein